MRLVIMYFITRCRLDSLIACIKKINDAIKYGWLDFVSFNESSDYYGE